MIPVGLAERPRRGYFCAMLIEPVIKRAIVFIDGQNLFRSAKDAFGYNYPNFEPTELAARVCAAKKWSLQVVHFYTGIHSPEEHPKHHKFWAAKLLMMSRRGVKTFSRPLRYRNKTVRVGSDRSEFTFRVAEEKGIDVRIAIDIIRLGHQREYDVALVFSQDQDLSEVADEIRRISAEQERWIRIASAYPDSDCRKKEHRRGINKTDWIPIDRALYDSCIDPKDYRK